MIAVKSFKSRLLQGSRATNRRRDLKLLTATIVLQRTKYLKFWPRRGVPKFKLEFHRKT